MVPLKFRLFGGKKPASVEELKFKAEPLVATFQGEALEKYPVESAYVFVADQEGRGLYLVAEPELTLEEQRLYSLLMESLYYSMKPAAKVEDPMKYVEGFVWESAEDLGIVEPVQKSFQKLKYFIARDAFGYGPLHVAMLDPDIEEISVTSYAVPVAVIHRRFTQYDWLQTNIVFGSEDTLRNYVQRLAQRAGKSVTVAIPMTDAMTKEGHRIAVTFADEITLPGSSISIRKFPEAPFSMAHLLKFKTLTPLMAAYLWLQVEYKGFVMVIGAMGCYDAETEVLTRRGWVPFPEAREDDEILTMNPQTNRMEYVKPVRKLVYNYGGPMMLFEGRAVEFCVTPDHNMYVKGRRGGFKFRKASDLRLDWHFKKDGVWEGEEKKFFTLPGADERYQSLEIPMELWLQFLAWWLSEGCLRKDGNTHYHVIITQKKRCMELEEVLNKLPFKYCKREQPLSRGTYNYEINDKRLYRYLCQFGRSKEKFVPSYVKELSPRLIKVFLDAFLLGDGGVHKGQRIFRTTSKRLADDLQELLLKSGAAANVHIKKSRRRTIETLTVHGVRRHSVQEGYVYEVRTTSAEPGFNYQHRKPQTVQYAGQVYCFELPKYHLMYVRRHGKAFWCGNSGKSTMLNCLLTMIDPALKISTIEDVPELRIPHQSWQRFKARHTYSITEAKYDVDLMDLVKLSLRYRPDYITVGEVRGEEVRALVQAAALGHGCLATIHGEGPEAAVIRMKSPPMDVPEGNLMLVWSFVLLGRVRMPDGSMVRRVLEIAEVEPKDGRIELKRTFTWNARNDTFAPDEAEAIVKQSYRLKAVKRLTGWTDSELAEELNRRAEFLEKTVEEGKLSYPDFAEAVRRFYVAKRKGIR